MSRRVMLKNDRDMKFQFQQRDLATRLGHGTWLHPSGLRAGNDIGRPSLAAAGKAAIGALPMEAGVRLP